MLLSWVAISQFRRLNGDECRRAYSPEDRLAGMTASVCRPGRVQSTISGDVLSGMRCLRAYKSVRQTLPTRS